MKPIRPLLEYINEYSHEISTDTRMAGGINLMLEDIKNVVNSQWDYINELGIRISKLEGISPIEKRKS